MKILFIIQGEGRGHLTQALSLRQKLMAEGHEIVGVLVGKSPARRLPDFFLIRYNRRYICLRVRIFYRRLRIDIDGRYIPSSLSDGESSKSAPSTARRNSRQHPHPSAESSGRYNGYFPCICADAIHYIIRYDFLRD